MRAARSSPHGLGEHFFPCALIWSARYLTVIPGLFCKDDFQRGRETKQREKNPQHVGHRCVGTESGWKGEKVEPRGLLLP